MEQNLQTAEPREQGLQPIPEPHTAEPSKLSALLTRIRKPFAPLFRALEQADVVVFAHPRLVIAACFAVMLLVSAVKFRVFDPAQFYDANAILAAVASGETGIDRAFSMIIGFFRILSAPFGTLSLPAWGFLLLVPGAAVFAATVKKAPPESLAAFLMLLGFSVLLPFYVFTVGKDFLQYLLFFGMAAALLYLPTELWKLCGALVFVLLTTVFFRNYYVLMLGFSIGLFGVALLYRRQHTVSRRALFLLLFACAVVLALFVLRMAVPGLAEDLFTVRASTNMALGAAAGSDKVILDPLPLDRSVPGFLGNYIFAAIRMMLPVELCASVGDIPFAVFQLLLTALLLHNFLRSRKVGARTSVYALIIAFFLMSFVFEPDFGSWFRHESAAFPLLWLGIGLDKKTRRGHSHGISA